ncbi:hypothetical protein TRIATDRAFT_298089 [Trichoderma atroviride IMI 206040]|uniref:C2H2-type domain-containing protein n=1 Tax=Hypocrea atroviridis (strain ATCC 20476 / IMI 206040) TaxID=452589 RepID=G9NLG2_HYPAI|nr:uncharacterized protein TRIATDRAFT_298089 [Trichoderma atroviride IMI 206040]EHK48724.1 hypothetical protein TRIATDRAFT_298089 [Trichoderma atroviride IMI 206040]
MDTQNTFPATYAEENNRNNIVNDTEMSNVVDGGGVGTGLAPFDHINPNYVFDFGGMVIDPTLSNDIGLADDLNDGEMGIGSVSLDNEVFAGGTEDSGTEDSPATSVTKHRYSEVDNDGRREPGKMWCCDRWYSTKGGFQKHLDTGNPTLPCEAKPVPCSSKLFSTDPELKRHYRTAHKGWARANGLSDLSCSCVACGKTFTRPDNRNKHWKRFKRCREKIEQMKDT